MRARSLILMAAIGLTTVASAEVAAPGPTETAAWTQRTMLHVGQYDFVSSPTGTWPEVSCDRLYDDVTSVLVKLGAPPDKLRVDQRDCYTATGQRSVDVRFSVLTPSDTPRHRAGQLVEAHWQTVQLKGDCLFLQYVTDNILPLFPTRNVQHISRTQCEQSGIGLRAQVLQPVPEPPEP